MCVPLGLAPFSFFCACVCEMTKMRLSYLRKSGPEAIAANIQSLESLVLFERLCNHHSTLFADVVVVHIEYLECRVHFETLGYFRGALVTERM